MLENSYTLAVDEDLSGTGTTSIVLSTDEFYTHRRVYKEAAHTPAARKLVTVARTRPKKSGNYNGSEKVSLKSTRDYTVPNALAADISAPGLVELSTSFPVGVSAADRIKQLALLFAIATDAIRANLIFVDQEV